MGISIIICSKNKIALRKAKQNITDTIGCEFEIIHEDNSLNPISLSSMYNRLFPKANYDNIVFLHEDIEFVSTNWGHKIYSLLENQQIGLVGLSGSTYKSIYPGVWSASLQSTYRFSNSENGFEKNKQNTSFYNVAVIDGCFMAGKKNIFEENNFDERLIGFHGYDIDLSFRVVKKYSLVVAKAIDFIHFSNGHQNTDWIISSLYVHQKHINGLPKSTETLSKEDALFSDYLSAQNFYNAVFELNYSPRLIIKYYYLFVFKFFKCNKLRYTKKTLGYFVSRFSKTFFI